MSPTYAAALIVLFEGLVLWAVYPATSFYCDQFGGGPMSVGLMFALLSLPKIVSNPIFGRLSDRVGRRPLLAIASAGTLCGSVGWALAPSLGWLAVSRLVAGIFSAQSTLCQTVVADATRPERRAAALGIVGAAFGGSMMLGPIIGSWVAAHFSLAAVGWVCAGVQSLSVLTVLFLLRETRPAQAPPNPGTKRQNSDNVFRLPGVIPLLGVVFVTAVVAAQLTTLSLFTKDRYGFGEKQAGYPFAFFGVIGVFVQGGLVRALTPRLGERTTSALGLVALGAGFAMLALPLPEWALWLGMGLLGAGAALNMPATTALLSSCVDERRQGAVLGYQQGATSLGRGAGSAVMGALYGFCGPTVSYALTAALAVLATLLLLPVKSRAARAGESISPGVVE
jgi:MFS transporter, DHA1 family, tetracycline resistance protein